MRSRSNLIALALLALAGCTTKPIVVKPAVVIPGVDYTWKIIGHVLLSGASLSEEDAVAWNGREITVTKSAYASPFQGTCEEAGRSRRTRALADIVMELDAPRSILTNYELGESVTEYKLSCRERRRPPLAIYVDGDRAMTCYSGVCYFLRR
ncbi:MAG: hypothetical protein H0T79_16085 [Deltaproteobacteria bacterium]|nr:hypothetical protein [Deltaproteobacteria bacterium]